MLTVEQMKSLKKVNVCKDPEKTKARIAEDFKSASNATKNAIVELSGQTRASIYRVYETGVITPKTALSMAQILDVSPYYYTGAEDEKGSCSEEVLASFLKDHGFSDLLQEITTKPKRKYTRRAKPETEQTEQPADIQPEVDFQEDETLDQQDAPIELPPQEESEPLLVAPEDNSQKMNDAIESLDLESAILLLRGLYKRAEAGDKAEQLLCTVKKSLLE